ncbi:sensor histidine kinase [Spirillospora sp. NBC_01491]|uniref:sensor histidine kinase n=1 Tax=Spirillospora sp. NBC_01491 TaxID=2976007 RepID=UPI002E35078E|nr:histidine kinase [Spirillospora sp. NBC_01491]
MDLRREARNRAADVAVTAVAAGLGLIMLQAALETYPATQRTEIARDLPIGALACTVLLLFRRRWPVRVALLLSVMETLASSAMGASAMALFTLAVHRSWRTTAGIAALDAARVLVVFRLAPMQTDREYVEGVTVVLLSYTVIISVGMLIRSRRQLIESLTERARQAEEGQRLRVEEARLLERERLAREMHDVLAHRISLLAVHAGALEFRPDAPLDQRRAAGIIRKSAYEAMEDLREVIGVLRDDAAEAEPERPQPTLTDLPALVEESRRAGARVVLECLVPDPAAVPARIGRHAYRIVQEGLTNARKHAPGARVLVTVDSPAAAGLTIEIVNPLPPGFVPLGLPGAGAGLVGLGERVGMVGGTLEHGRTGDDRWRLRASLPLPG